MVKSIYHVLKRVDAQKVIAVITIFITLYFFGVSKFISSAFFVTQDVGGGYGTTDTTAPSITYKQVINIGTGTATVKFGFTDDTYTSTAGGTGSITLTPYAGGTGSTSSVSVTFGSPNVASAVFNGLSADTKYNYSISVSDNYGNSSAGNGTFYTASNPISLTGGTVNSTGSTSLTGNNVGNGDSLDLSGTTLNISNDGDSSDSLTGTLTITGALTIVVSGSTWNGVILPPTEIASGSSEAATTGELSGLLPTVAASSTNVILGTVKAGAEGTTLLASGGYFTISFYVAGGTAGDIIYLYRSLNGISWEANSPDRTCTLDSGLMCTFQTNHLTYFATTKIVTTTSSATTGGGNIPTISTSTGGGGGGTSYTYTATTATTTGEVAATTTGTQVISDERIKYIEDKIDEYSATSTDQTYTINGTSVEIKIPTFKDAKTTQTIKILNSKIVDMIASKKLDGESLKSVIDSYNKFLGAIQIYKDEGNEDAKTLAKIYAKQMLATISKATTVPSSISQAIAFGYANGLTKYSNESDFRTNDTISRQEAAKFLSEFAQKVMGKTADTSKECEFTDVVGADESLKSYITLSCQLGVFKGTSNNEFKPFDNLTKGQTLGVVLRTGLGILDETTDPWYKNYYNKAISLGIIDSKIGISSYESNATRGEVITLMYNYAKYLGKTN